MNCTDWEERLTLYGGGDLAPEQVAEVEKHLAECAGCQMFASGLKSSMEVLQGAHQDVPAEAHFAAVRARVLAQLERERRPLWRRAWVYGIAALAAAVLTVVAVRPSRWVVEPLPEVTILHAPAAPEVYPMPPRPQQVARVAHRSRVKPGEPLMVKLITDNPDVVIYWISETKGEN